MSQKFTLILSDIDGAEFDVSGYTEHDGAFFETWIRGLDSPNVPDSLKVALEHWWTENAGDYLEDQREMARNTYAEEY